MSNVHQIISRAYSTLFNTKLVFVVLVLIVLSIFFYDPQFFQSISESLKIDSLKGQLTLTPTPYPNQDVTIPALRKRTYSSSLNDRTLYVEKNTYNFYLTSYDSDGLTINGLLTIPNGDKPINGWPAIVFVHGYIPPTLYKTTEKYGDYIDYLARNGFVVFKIDLRGHGDSEGTPSGAYFSADYIIDTLNAYAALQQSDFVNPNAVGLWGHSMAGNVLLRSFVVKPEIPAVVIWAGAVFSYTDREKYGISDNSYRPPADITRRAGGRLRLGDVDKKSIFWQEFVPTNYLSDLKGAIQLNHAINDDVVNIGYSRDLNALLDETNVTHELNEYPGGGHNISGVNFVSAMENTVEFFENYLDK